MPEVDRERPCLRPVEAIPDPANGRVILRDPTQLAAGILVVGQAELFLLSLLDGQRGRIQIQAEYARRCGELILSHELDSFLAQLDGAGFLAADGFETHYARRGEEPRRLASRPLRSGGGFGAPLPELPAYLEGALAEAGEALPASPAGRLRAIVAPHLDFPRGRPCYAAGYQRFRKAFASGSPPSRVVVLGTNHFGRSASVVATGKDFETPWGVLPTDREFLERIQAACGGNLMPYELDHLREHSIELHAVWLRHLLGEEVRIVPVLCPDPTSGRPGDPGGVDLRAFALALGRLLREDPEPTLLVASADLSHVGG